MWSGTAASYVNMNPPGAIGSRIRAAAGTLQGGAATFNATQGARAGLWSGTAASFVSVHPGGQWGSSQIDGMTETEQVGAVALPFPNGHPEAALWHGSAASFVLLDPPQSGGYSELLGTCGTAQVGYIAPASGIFAGIWFGSASSFLNLDQFLPPGVYDESRATSIATDGVHYYVGGYAENTSTFRNEAFLWVGTVPEPAAGVWLGGVALIAARRRR
jgi:MYXO-CTERM domain-containing protein